MYTHMYVFLYTHPIFVTEFVLNLTSYLNFEVLTVKQQNFNSKTFATSSVNYQVQFRRLTYSLHRG